VKLVQIYECLCDETRLRILHLLAHAPLCVCHFQSVLREPQVKISKHLNYLKARGLVESRQHQNWRIYKLPDQRGYELAKHLQCLQDCIHERELFRDDLKRLQSVTHEAASIASNCCEPTTKRGQKESRLLLKHEKVLR
jgi:ArsR family transcriptional regulator